MVFYYLTYKVSFLFFFLGSFVKLAIFRCFDFVGRGQAMAVFLS